jgi:hypothetical protein
MIREHFKGGVLMFRKSLLFILVLIMALSVISCDSGKKISINTDNVKKFVEKSKNNGPMSYERTKKAYKGVFPNIKMK